MTQHEHVLQKPHVQPIGPLITQHGKEMSVVPIRAEEKPKLKRLEAKLTIENRGKEVIGRLQVGDLFIESNRGADIGMVAVIAHLSITATAPIRPSIEYRIASGRNNQNLERLRHELDADMSIQPKKRGNLLEQVYFMIHVQSMLQLANSAARRFSTLSELSHLEGRIERAKHLVPEALHRVTRFPRATAYCERGRPLTPSELEMRRVHERFRNAMEAGPEQISGPEPGVSWKYVVRMPDAHGPIALNGPSYVEVQRFVARHHFPRMPNSFAELYMAVEWFFCMEVCMWDPFNGGRSDDKWIASLRKVTPENPRLPEVAPLLVAFIDGDEEKMREEQARIDCFAAFGRVYDEAEYQKVVEQVAGGEEDGHQVARMDSDASVVPARRHLKLV